MSEEINCNFIYKKKIKKENFFSIDTIEDLKEWAHDNFDIAKDQKIIFKIPPQIKKRENIKIDSFYDVETYNYFCNIISQINSKDPLFLKSNFKIEIEQVSEYPEGLPTLQKCIENSIKINKLKIVQKLITEITTPKLDIESQKYNIDKLNNNKFLNACHNNVTCNNCFKQNFIGLRFICTECNKFNLCENCESLRVMKKIEHNPNHLFIQIAHPINIDNYTFNNLIQKKRQVINIYKIPNEEKIKVNFIIHNIGENSFKNCFLYPICYGENFLFGNIVKIENDVSKGENISVDIEFDMKINSGTYYSKWRMFTELGIPFGEIIYLTFIVLQFK